MAIHQHREHIKTVLKNSLRNKFLHYAPEPAVMPFHTRLLGKDRLALYSFIHSLNTNFGTTIFEPVAEALAEPRFKTVKRGFIPKGIISANCQTMIQSIIDDLGMANDVPNKLKEYRALT